jgi:hypothetical protein
MARRGKKPAAELPIWTDEALTRLLGACDGYVHAMVDIKFKIESYHGQYRGRFHPRHVRLIERRDDIVRPMRQLHDQLEADLRRCQEAYKREYARAHPVSDRVGPARNP